MQKEKATWGRRHAGGGLLPPSSRLRGLPTWRSGGSKVEGGGGFIVVAVARHPRGEGDTSGLPAIYNRLSIKLFLNILH